MHLSWDNLLALFSAFTQVSWANLLMIGVGCMLIYLAIAKEYEPGC